MSRESIEWLNKYTLVGFGESRTHWEGNGYTRWSGGKMSPWWEREGYDGFYPGAIPIEAVEQRLFFFDIDAAPLCWKVRCDMNDPRMTGVDDNGPYRLVEDATGRVIYRTDDDTRLNVVEEGFRHDQYKRTLLDNVAATVDRARGELGIGSAMLLRKGGVASVSIELPDVIETPSGYAFRPALTAVDSYNSEFRYMQALTLGIPVCDNSLMSFTNRATHQYFIKHTKESGHKIAEARDALGLVFRESDAFAAEIAALAAWEVTGAQFDATLDATVPMPDPIIGDKGQVTNQRAITNADNKRQQIVSLYMHDERAATWKGTALGVFQAFDTYYQHYAMVRGMTDEDGVTTGGNRVERNHHKMLKGEQSKRDSEVMDTLAKVCDVKLKDLVTV